MVELPESGSHNATLIREKISDKVLDSEEFRTGVIYAYSNTYLKVYPTVDIAVFRNNKIEILLGKKKSTTNGDCLVVSLTPPMKVLRRQPGEN